MTYDFTAIEERWQAYWAEHRTFRTPNPGDEGFEASKPKFYVLDMFPYPSGVGLHVGHPLGYIATDIFARYKRMIGYNVLHPMGYDAFGLPAEQFAVETGVHPRITTEKNIANMTRQLKRLGLAYDWDRCLATTDVDYYKWTQWIFLQMYNAWFDPAQGSGGKARPISELVRLLESEQLYVWPDGDLIETPAEGLDGIEGPPPGTRKWHELSPQEQRSVIDSHRLAYMDELPVNWCPALGTVLANEEVTNEGRSERGNHPVYKRPLRQWMLRITAYAQRLLEDLDHLDWPEPIKLMQRHWIGRSEGAMVDFAVEGSDELIRVFTTRPDTLFGATYMVLAPEHPLVDEITTDEQRDAVRQYQRDAEARSDMDRIAETAPGQKTGVCTGAVAVNPVNGEKTPIWIADYVLMGYGTGAIMAVPAHDERDMDFARAESLSVRAVVMPDPDWIGGNLDYALGRSDSDRAKQLVLSEWWNDKNDPEYVRKVIDFYLCETEAFPAYMDEGTAVNSANDVFSINDLPTPDAKKAITAWLDSKDLGQFRVQYKLRDWLFSRQRYWGEPFPILHSPDGELVAVDESQLPVPLPQMEDFTPQASDDPHAPPQPPLARAPDSWKYVTIDGVTYTREFNTMPQWAGSCW